MARLPATFNFGQNIFTAEQMLLLSKMYTAIITVINGQQYRNPNASASTPPSYLKFCQVYVTDTAPTATAEINRLFEEGDEWVDRSVTPDKVYKLTARTDADTVTWTALN